MQLQLDARNIDLTPSLKELTEKKIEKLSNHSKHILSLHIVLSVEKHLQIAKATMKLPHTELNASAESEDLYKSIDQLIAKLDRLMLKHKPH